MTSDPQPRFAGRVAFVTGAARGQGRNHAVRLAESGADIIAIDVAGDNVPSVTYPLATTADLEQTVKLVEEQGRRIVATHADVRDLDAMVAAVDDGVAQLGRLDIVCANAGIVGHGRWDELTPQAWQDMIGINLTGVWHTCRAAIPHLVAGGRGGSIVLTSSTLGLKGMPHLVHYAAAKHGIVGVMRSLAAELAVHRIRVNSIHPTSVDTAMIHNAASYQLFRPDLTAPTIDDVRPGFADLNLLPVAWMDLDDVTNAVCFLASDESRYITGVTLPIDAGLLIK